ncbi:unnamed protein product [Sphagnum balticum]
MAEDNRDRMTKALDTMLLELQVPRQIVNPILRKLLQTYENEWDHIEADGYRVLADAIFQHQEQMPTVQNDNLIASTPKVTQVHAASLIPSRIEASHASVVRNGMVGIEAPLDVATTDLKPTMVGKLAPIHDACKGKFPIDKFKIERLAEYPLQKVATASFKGVTALMQVAVTQDKGDSSHKRIFTPSQEVVKEENSNKLISDSKRKQLIASETVVVLKKPKLETSGGCPELQNIVDSTVKEGVCVNSNMGLMDSASIGRDGSQVVQEVPDGGVKQIRHMSSEKNSKPPRGQRTRALKDRASSPSTSSGSSQRANRVRQSNRKPQSESERLVGPQEAEMSDEIDLSRGSEQIPISVEEFARSRVPRDFLYVSQSIVYQNAYIRFSLARIADEDCCKDCSGNCLASRYPCACARQSGGEYAYSLQGTLRKRFMEQEKQRRRAPVSSLSFCQAGQCPNERLKGETNLEPCKGHTQRRFIKECWEKCGCDKSCSNRVVQRGINCKLQVFWTVEGKGWGLRTLDDLPAGAFVCEYAGEILTNLEMDERNCSSTANTKHHFPLQLDADWSSERFLKDEEALCLDGTYFGNVARFINHRCFDNNMLDVPVEIESPDHHYYHVAFFTSREVKANEELTWDYGLDFSDKEHPIEAFKCQCGSPYCRGKE